MDNTVTAKYYIVKPQDVHAPLFLDVLTDIHSYSFAEREHDVNVAGKGSPVIVRLERLDDAENGYVTGELIRKQVDNIPPEANDDGLAPIELSEGGGLAYSSAFCFHPETSCLLLQANPIAVGYSRLSLYLSAANEDATYEFDPVVKEDSWTRFNSGVPRKLAIRIASPSTHTPNLSGEADTVAGGASTLAEALGAAYITIEVSMGTRKGSLARAAVEKVIKAFRDKDKQNEMDIRLLNASVKSDDKRTDLIDFLDEYLVFRDVFDLPSDNTELNYEIRKNALKTAMKGNIKHIRDNYT